MYFRTFYILYYILTISLPTVFAFLLTHSRAHFNLDRKKIFWETRFHTFMFFIFYKVFPNVLLSSGFAIQLVYFHRKLKSIDSRNTNSRQKCDSNSKFIALMVTWTRRLYNEKSKTIQNHKAYGSPVRIVQTSNLSPKSQFGKPFRSTEELGARN